MGAFTVYKHTSPSGKVYIGITQQRPEKRWQNGYGYARNAHFFNAIIKYGWNNFTHEILATGLTKDEACAMERSLILQYRSNDPEYGYNTADGGEHYEHAPESIARMRIAKMGHFISDETRKRISEAKRGKRLSAEHRKKLSEARRGEKHPRYGAKHSEESRRKISESIRGEKHPCYGVHLKEETRQRLREANKAKAKPVVCTDTQIEFASLGAAAQATGICKAHISECCRGKRHTAGGFHWAYVTETEGVL